MVSQLFETDNLPPPSKHLTGFYKTSLAIPIRKCEDIECVPMNITPSWSTPASKRSPLAVAGCRRRSRETERERQRDREKERERVRDRGVNGKGGDIFPKDQPGRIHLRMREQRLVGGERLWRWIL